MSSIRLALSVSSLIAGASALFAASGVQAQQAARAPDTVQAVPRYAVLPWKHPKGAQPAAGGLTTWNFDYTYSGKPYSDVFVGNPPSGAATTTPTFIIPLTIVVSGQTFSNATVQANGKTALANTRASPIFKGVVDFTEGGANLGKTQYEDAFQRESFWPTVLTNTGYHVRLGAPTVLKAVRVDATGHGSVGKEFGVRVALVDINWLDGQIQNIIAANPQITAASIPIFEMYDTYETSNGCCIGGYHSYNGVETYAVFDYIGTSGVFSQDVSALSHEMGEWLDDPYTNNSSPCGIYEVGDPLEGDANYGDYAYAVGTMTYHLQDLAQPPYFGAPPSTSLGGRTTFQGTALSVCQNGS